MFCNVEAIIGTRPKINFFHLWCLGRHSLFEGSNLDKQERTPRCFIYQLKRARHIQVTTIIANTTPYGWGGTLLRGDCSLALNYNVYYTTACIHNISVLILMCMDFLAPGREAKESDAVSRPRQQAPATHEHAGRVRCRATTRTTITVN